MSRHQPHRRIHIKPHSLYQRLIHHQFSLPAISFILIFACIAGNIVCARNNLAHAASLLPADLTTVTASGQIYLTPNGIRLHPGKDGQTGATTSRDITANASESNKSTNSTQTTQPTVTTDLPKNTPQSAPVSTPTPAPAAVPSAGNWTYPLHTNIKTTYFWAGEAASADNDFIQNIESAWQSNWAAYFGGEDNPSNRCGYRPCAFAPRENAFYFALPFGDFTDSGPKSNLSIVPWYNAAAQARLNSGQSILKNRWIQINLGSKTAYAQWEDVGPFNDDDGAYVFGTAAPRSSRAGLDVSPAVRDYLGMGGSASTSWRFVTDAEVPAGPWKTTITTSGTDWN